MPVTQPSSEELACEENISDLQSAGRTKRSAAVHSKNAWQSLVKHPHLKKDDETEEADLPAEKFEKLGKWKTTVSTPISRKRLRGFTKTKTEILDDSTVDEEEAAYNLKTLTPQKKQRHLEKNLDDSPFKMQEIKEKIINVERKPRLAVPILAKRLPVLMPRSADSQRNTIDGKPQIFRGTQMLLPNSGALNKEQLEKIEREVDKHQFTASQEAAGNDHDEEDEEIEKIKLDDDDDLDYEEPSSRSSKKSALRKRNNKKRGRPSNSNVSTPVDGVPLPQLRKVGDDANKVIILNPNGGNSMPPLNYSGTYPPQLRSRDGEFVGTENRTVKVIRIRSANNLINSTAASSSGSHLNVQRHHQIIPSVSYNDMVLSLNKEISDLSEKYQKHVIPGASVQHFNDIIDQITGELNRVVEEKTRIVASNRDYVEHLNMSHMSQLEYKDRKIQQLENTVETLQSKLNVAFKRIQLNALKNDTVVSNGSVNQSLKETDDKIVLVL